MWTLAKVLIAVGLLALAVALVRLFMPVEVDGVQDCGAPVTYLLFDREEIRPPDTPLLADFEGCRDLATSEFSQGMLALAVGIGLGLVGAILGLTDDRWMLHRAPRFESMLRRKPEDAPVALRAGSTAKALSQGRTLPVLDPVDVLYLPVGMLATFILLRAIAGGSDLVDAYEVAAHGWMLPALVGAVLLPLAAAAQLVAGHPGLSVGRAAEITVATSFRAEASPSLGPYGLAAFLFARRGTARGEAIAQLGGIGLASAGSHALLLLVFLLVGRITTSFLQIPDRWWALVLLAVLSLIVGFLRGLTPGGRLVARPDVAAARTLVETVRSDPGRGAVLVASSLAIPLVSGLVLAWTASWAGIEIPLTVAIGVVLVAQLVGALGPMPGGVGLFEPVAVWGLVGAGAALPAAVLAVLAQRVLVYWLPMGLGAVVSNKTTHEVLDDPVGPGGAAA